MQFLCRWKTDLVLLQLQYQTREFPREILTLFLYSPAVCFHKEYTLYGFVLFLDKHESAKPHMLSMRQKVVDNIFLFFYQKKRPKPKFWQAHRERFFKLPFWGILPSFSVYAAFLFMRFAHPEPTVGRGGRLQWILSQPMEKGGRMRVVPW